MRRYGASLAEYRDGALLLEVRQRLLHLAGDLLVDLVVVGAAAEAVDQVDRRESRMSSRAARSAVTAAREAEPRGSR